jgi:hypothetical protein
MKGVQLQSDGDGTATMLTGSGVYRLDGAQVKELFTVFRLRGRSGMEFQRRLEAWLATGEHPLSPILRPTLHGPRHRR